MRHNRRRFLMVVLALGLILAACAPATPVPTSEPTAQPSQTPQPTQTSAPTATPTPAWLVDESELRGLKIYFLHPWAGETARVIETLVDQFNQSNPQGIHVIAQSSGSQVEVYDQVEARLESEDRPTVAVATAEQARSWLLKDRLLDLAIFANDPQVGLGAGRIDDWLPVYAGQFRVGEQLLGLPLMGSLRMLFYNRTWAQELGYSQAPGTPQEFRQQACAAMQANATDTVGENDGTGGWFIDAEPLTVLGWLRAFGVEEVTGEDDLDYTFDQEGSLAALQFLRGMVDDDCAWLGRLPAPYDYFAGRNALFYTGSLEEITAQAGANQRAGSADQWTVLPFPSESGEPVATAEGTALVVLGGESSQELAGWYFARWLSEPGNQARLAKAEGSAPASREALESAGGSEQWQAAVDLLDSAITPPARASWRVARMVVEDAVWQSMQSYLPYEQIAILLRQLDATIREVGEQRGF